MIEVFVSYSSLDREYAFRMRDILEKYNCHVWLDFFDIKPGEQVKKELYENIKKANVLCILLSPTSVASEWVKTEVKYALAEKDQGLRIIPIILRSCKVPALLKDVIAIDARDGFDNESTSIRLIRSITGENTVSDNILLDAANREELSVQEKQLEADKLFPDIANDLHHLHHLYLKI